MIKLEPGRTRFYNPHSCSVASALVGGTDWRFGLELVNAGDGFWFLRLWFGPTVITTYRSAEK